MTDLQIKKNLILVIFFTLIFLNGCISNTGNDINPQTQIIKDITVDEAYILIQNNSENQNFIILDIRTKEEYQNEHIQNSIMIDFYTQTHLKANLMNLIKINPILFIVELGDVQV